MANTREEAWELLKEYNQEPFHLQHGLTVEGCLRYFAQELGYGDEEDFWGMVGLLHDLDFEKYPEQHCRKYGNGTETSGTVKILKDLDYDVAGKHLIIIEDIIDSGTTMNYLMKYFRERKPKSVKLCALLSKPSRRTVDVNIDYCGYTVPDEFLVGYGLDYAEKYRNLPYIGVLKPEIYA